jgi:hypothetical protein
MVHELMPALAMEAQAMQLSASSLETAFMSAPDVL